MAHGHQDGLRGVDVIKKYINKCFHFISSGRTLEYFLKWFTGIVSCVGIILCISGIFICCYLRHVRPAQKRSLSQSTSVSFNPMLTRKESNGSKLYVDNKQMKYSTSLKSDTVHNSINTFTKSSLIPATEQCTECSTLPTTEYQSEYITCT